MRQDWYLEGQGEASDLNRRAKRRKVLIYHFFRILRVMNDDDADRAMPNIVLIANRVVVVKPDTCRRGPTQRVPLIRKCRTWRNAVALFELSHDPDARPSRGLSGWY